MDQLYIASQSLTQAFVAFGSNLDHGNRTSHDILRNALKSLTEKGVRLVNNSRYYRSPAVPKGAGPDYVNSVAEIRTNLGASDFLSLLHEVEGEHGRQRHARWSSRALDLDLLSHGDSIVPNNATFDAWRALNFEDQIQKTPTEMILPHPRMQDRAFVLVPLAEIAPDWRHPVLGKTAAELCDALPLEDRVALVPIDPA